MEAQASSTAKPTEPSVERVIKALEWLKNRPRKEKECRVVHQTEAK